MTRPDRQQQVVQSEVPLTSGLVQRMNPQEQRDLEGEPEKSALHESRFQSKMAAIPIQRKAETPETTTGKETKRPNNTGLPDRLKAGLEQLSGVNMSNVRVHYNSPKPSRLNALAYTQGSDIHVGPGQEKHLPHEAWHVVQQAQGRVKPTIQMKSGIPINDDAGLEHEADVMGDGANRLFRNWQHTKGCSCGSCVPKKQKALISTEAPSFQVLPTSVGTATLQLMCNKGHPKHKAGKCPYSLPLATYRLPPKHVKGYRGKGFTLGKTTQAAKSVMEHAKEQIELGTPGVTSTKGPDVTLEIPRQHRHRSKKTRTFFVHKSMGDGSAHDFFMKHGEPSDSESSESEKEAED
jgi:hypothetical protein